MSGEDSLLLLVFVVVILVPISPWFRQFVDGRIERSDDNPFWIIFALVAAGMTLAAPFLLSALQDAANRSQQRPPAPIYSP